MSYSARLICVVIASVVFGVYMRIQGDYLIFEFATSTLHSLLPGPIWTIVSWHLMYAGLLFLFGFLATQFIAKANPMMFWISPLVALLAQILTHLLVFPYLEWSMMLVTNIGMILGAIMPLLWTRRTACLQSSNPFKH